MGNRLDARCVRSVEPFVKRLAETVRAHGTGTLVRVERQDAEHGPGKPGDVGVGQRLFRPLCPGMARGISRSIVTRCRNAYRIVQTNGTD
jgi:hypothetical protein